MNLTFLLRNNLKNMPYSIGKYVAQIPFSYRPGIGKSYSTTKKKIQEFHAKSNGLKEDFLFHEMKNITTYAYHSIPFYNEFYKSLNFSPEIHLNSFSDIKSIPIINKNILINYELEKRSNNKITNMIVNTGGSSGKPFTLLVPPEKMGIEWSHLHYIWNLQMGFKPKYLKILMVGRSDIKDNLEYDFIRHSLRLDLYSSFEEIAKKILSKYKNVSIYFIHGYPSAIYELAIYCSNDQILLNLLRKNLKGIILNSEYPNEHDRKIIEKVFNVKTFAFYGHTEGCVIAYETERNRYHPMHTYGYVESELCNGIHNLIGTNYYNRASPLIRYNSEDSIYNVKYEQSILKSFSINEGRNGEYVLDNNNKNISLTGLIFGRHHKLFDYCSHIQARQNEQGKLEILYVLLKKEKLNVQTLFDGTNIQMDFQFKELDAPIRTVSGKVKLLV